MPGEDDGRVQPGRVLGVTNIFRVLPSSRQPPVVIRCIFWLLMFLCSQLAIDKT